MKGCERVRGLTYTFRSLHFRAWETGGGAGGRDRQLTGFFGQ